MHYPNQNEFFTLECDVSDTGVGAILTQKKGIIGIYSGKLKKPEVNYATTEKEFLGIIKALKHFRKIIYGGQVNIITDHANLLFNAEISSNRVQRWKILLTEYDYTLGYKKGS